jgi:4-hydroxythreonine-4-phosphate dehydrogenase
MQRSNRPRLLVTLGDVAGIGPEIVLRGWPELIRFGVPTVVGDVASLRRQARLFRLPYRIEPVAHAVSDSVLDAVIPCIQATERDLQAVDFGQVHPAAGGAAYDFLCRAVAEVQTGHADAIVTAPINKAALAAAGLTYPGHTEILAELCGVQRFAMMLFACRNHDPAATGDGLSSRATGTDWQSETLNGWGVAHVTLHVRLRDIFEWITTPAVLEKTELLGHLLQRLLRRPPRLAVCALNPHASDGGLFGDEEDRIIRPAIEEARRRGWEVTGPWPADTLFPRAARGEVDGIVAMYHDQGHIPFKLLAGFRAVNVTLGLPFVRTSVAHGTGYDIAGRGVADVTSLIEATRVAARLAQIRE